MNAERRDHAVGEQEAVRGASGPRILSGLARNEPPCAGRRQEPVSITH